MANIRVKCPTCQTDLEIDAEFESQEVECGNCLQVFVAKSASSSSSGSRAGTSSRRRDRDDDDDDDEEERRPKKRKKKRRRRDYDDDDDDYDDDYYDSGYRRGGGGGSNGLAITSLILGIMSIIPCALCGCLGMIVAIAAIITGGIGMSNENGKGLAAGGLITGIIGLLLNIVLTIVSMGMNNGNGGGGGFR